MADYGGELTLQAECGDQKAVEETKEKWVQRATRFMGRGLSGGVGLLGKACKRKRVKSMHWGLALDNCLKFTCGHGVEAFELTEKVRQKCPYDWPKLQVIPDQGPDGMCMGNAFAYGWQNRVFNIHMAFDKSHGAHNDVKGAVKAAGLWSHQLLAAVAAAAPFSPWNTGTRRQQVKEAMVEYFEHMDQNCPLFQECLPLLLKEAGQSHRMTENGIDREVWKALKEDRIWDEAGTKLSLSRFQSTVAHARKDVDQWTKRFLGMMYCGMELGCVSEDLFDKMEKEMEKEKAEPATGKTSTAQDEIKRHRALTNNNLAIACMYYSDYENRHKQAMIRDVCGSVYRWHCEQNRATRSAAHTYSFEMKMLKGEWLDHIRDIWRQLSNYDSMKAAGLIRSLQPSYLKAENHGADMCLLAASSHTYCTLIKSLVLHQIRCLFFAFQILSF